jgi:acyl dehydratase
MQSTRFDLSKDAGVCVMVEETRPIGARVTLDMIGSTTGDYPIAWTEHETLLYALGVGAGLGDAESELNFTTENSCGISLEALPSYLSVLAQAAKAPALRMLDSGRFLHAEQRIEVVRPLPPAGSAILRSTISSVLDKGTDAIMTQVSSLRDAESNTVIGGSVMRIFVKGAGGFGGPRGRPQPFAYPDRAPDLCIRQETRPEQALLYRLSGDRNPLHSDPAFARERGFEKPILHGLCTYGFACRALVAGAAEGDATRLRMIDGRFRRPVYPGDMLSTEMWFAGAGEVFFRTLDGSGEAVIERGRAMTSS